MNVDEMYKFIGILTVENARLGAKINELMKEIESLKPNIEPKPDCQGGES